jgi:hypothetical protein
LRVCRAPTNALCKASWTSLNYRGLKLSLVPAKKKHRLIRKEAMECTLTPLSARA